MNWFIKQVCLSTLGPDQGEEIYWSHKRTVMAAPVLVVVQYNNIYLSTLDLAQGEDI